MSGIPHAESIRRMEEDGTMDARREQLAGWLEEHPRCENPAQAVADLGFTFADHMNVEADSIWMDMKREREGVPGE
jgi:hypothetical protein